MSAVKTSEQTFVVPLRYQVVKGAVGFGVCDMNRVAREGLVVDLFRSQCAAEYAARLLNSGLATVDPHAVLGCKVVAR